MNISDEIEPLEFGKFVHIIDAEGSKIELWQPYEKVSSEIGKKNTK